MSEIDDNIVTATKKTRKYPILIAVAAAASLAVIMGAAVVNKSYVVANGDRVMDMNLTVKKDVNTDPYEQFLEIDAETIAHSNSDGDRWYELTACPSEVFEVLNIHTLLNDNFTDEASEISVSFDNVRNPTRLGYLNVRCFLTDKKTGVELTLSINGILAKDIPLTEEWNYQEEYELLDLNNGSKALVYKSDIPMSERSRWSGSFCYDGFVYTFHTEYTEYDAFMQTLDDLGIL